MGNGKIDEIKRHLQTALSLVDALGKESESSGQTSLEQASEEPGPQVAGGPSPKQLHYLQGQIKKGNLKEMPENLTGKQWWLLVNRLKKGEKVGF